MNRYEVTLQENSVFFFDEIEAESEEDAVEIAYIVLQEEGRDKYFYDMEDGEALAYLIKEKQEK